MVRCRVVHHSEWDKCSGINLPACLCVQVDGVNIQGYSNQQAVEVLRHTGQTVHLKLVRRGFDPENACPPILPAIMDNRPASGASKISTMEAHGSYFQHKRKLFFVVLAVISYTYIPDSFFTINFHYILKKPVVVVSVCVDERSCLTPAENSKPTSVTVLPVRTPEKQDGKTYILQLI